MGSDEPHHFHHPGTTSPLSIRVTRVTEQPMRLHTYINTVPFFSIVGVGMLRVSPLLSSPAFPTVGVCRASSGVFSIVARQLFKGLSKTVYYSLLFVLCVYFAQVDVLGREESHKDSSHPRNVPRCVFLTFHLGWIPPNKKTSSAALNL